MKKIMLITHRVNSLAQLTNCPPNFGVEIDIRNHGSELIVTHDPFDLSGPKLQDWLEAYCHDFLIVNVKEEGLEEPILSLLEMHDVKHYFILDESLPYIRKFALSGLENFAVRYSEIESVETAMNLQTELRKYDRSIAWVWCDTFNGLPPVEVDIQALRAVGLKICQVSPELHFVDQPSVWEHKINKFHQQLTNCDQTDVWPDMICTKCPEVWQNLLGS